MTGRPSLPSDEGLRRSAIAAERNLAPILSVLSRVAPASGRALEIASGTGQHITAFAAAHPAMIWQGTDRDAGNLASMSAWAAHAAAPNLLPPRVLDAGQSGWSAGFPAMALVIMVNLLHLISISAARTVLTESARILTSGGRLLIYGPFLRDGTTTSDGDRTFHAELQARDPQIGYKDVAWVRDELSDLGFRVTTENMPANNLMIIAFKP